MFSISRIDPLPDEPPVQKANILVDGTGCARLADFGLLKIMSDPRNQLSSSSAIGGGTVRWMGPELIAPEQFGLKKSRLTKSSDCYALGMVIYEIITGNLPFHNDTEFSISLKVSKGEWPPRRAKFTDRLWEMVESCWASQPDSRSSVEDVLQCLEAAPKLSEEPSPGPDDELESDSDSGSWSSLTASLAVQISNC